jgi:hypothetical protein
MNIKQHGLTCEKWRSKRNKNCEYFDNNYDELQSLYGGKNIVIVNEKVSFATLDFDEYCKKWELLTTEEQLEAFNTYMRKIGEIIVI